MALMDRPHYSGVSYSAGAAISWATCMSGIAEQIGQCCAEVGLGARYCAAAGCLFTV